VIVSFTEAGGICPNAASAERWARQRAYAEVKGATIGQYTRWAQAESEEQHETGDLPSVSQDVGRVVFSKENYNLNCIGEDEPILDDDVHSQTALTRFLRVPYLESIVCESSDVVRNETDHHVSENPAAPTPKMRPPTTLKSVR
jgi:hypothetical protein